VYTGRDLAFPNLKINSVAVSVHGQCFAACITPLLVLLPYSDDDDDENDDGACAPSLFNGRITTEPKAQPFAAACVRAHDSRYPRDREISHMMGYQ
jgi:hypothetical protein